MCGIAGVIGEFDPDNMNYEKIKQSMFNRGPNFFGHKIFKKDKFTCLLFHSRLSIIDLSSLSNQPLDYENFCMVYNGEIYNYVELKKELQALGYRFKTSSDTEVVLIAFDCWGDKCFEKFEGMWSVAIFDKRTFSLKLSRDRFGEKPLYYSVVNNTLYFASETKTIHLLKNIRDKVNYKQIKRLLVNGYKSLFKLNETYYENIKYLEPSTSLHFSCKSKCEKKKYWNFSIESKKISLNDCKDFLSKKFKDIMIKKMRSDVPISFCLSGGVDSNLLLSIASENSTNILNTFSIYDKDSNYDESENITKTLRHLNIEKYHNKIDLNKVDFLDNLKKQTLYNDAPISTISFFVSSLLANEINKKKIPVTIQGNGADEFFTGYYHHYNYFLLNKPETEMKLWIKNYKKNIRNPYLNDFDTFKYKQNEHIYFGREENLKLLNDDFIENFIQEDFSDDLLKNRMLNESFNEVLPVLLHENDLAFMRCSVENRNPFLDKELFEFIFSISSDLLIREGYLKYLLRFCVSDSLPNHIKFDRKKKGFNASISSMINVKNKEFKDFILSESKIFEIINKDKLSKFIEEYKEQNSLKKTLFAIISTKFFMEQNSYV